MAICAKCGNEEADHIGLNGTTKVCPSGTFKAKVTRLTMNIGDGEGGYRVVSGDEYKIARAIIDEMQDRETIIVRIDRG